MLLPSGRRVKVRGVQVHGARAAVGRRGAARRGEPAAAWTSHDISRGETLTRDGRVRGRRAASTRSIDLLPDAKPLRHGARVRFHHGTTELLGRVALRGWTNPGSGDAGSGRGRSPSCRRGEPGVCAHPARGAGGADARRSLHPAAVLAADHDRRRTRARSGPGADADPDRGGGGAVRARSTGDGASAALAFVEERRGAGLSIDALARRAGLDAGRRAALAAARWRRPGRVRVVGDELFDARRWCARWKTQLVAAVDRASPRAADVRGAAARRSARADVRPGARRRCSTPSCSGSPAAGKLTGRDRLALPGRGVSLTPEEARAQEALDRVFRDAGLAPPDLTRRPRRPRASPRRSPTACRSC